jgi:hypothetical protein
MILNARSTRCVRTRAFGKFAWLDPSGRFDWAAPVTTGVTANIAARPVEVRRGCLASSILIGELCVLSNAAWRYKALQVDANEPTSASLWHQGSGM